MTKRVQFHLLSVLLGIVTFPILLFIDPFGRNAEEMPASFSLGLGIFVVLEFIFWFMNKSKGESTRKSYHLLVVIAGFVTFLIFWSLAPFDVPWTKVTPIALSIGMGMVVVLELVYWFISGSEKAEK